LKVFHILIIHGIKKDRKSTSGYCTYIRDNKNMVTWSNKKQSVVSRSSDEVEYSAMAHAASEMM